MAGRQGLLSTASSVTMESGMGANYEGVGRGDGRRWWYGTDWRRESRVSQRNVIGRSAVLGCHLKRGLHCHQDSWLHGGRCSLQRSAACVHMLAKCLVRVMEAGEGSGECGFSAGPAEAKV